MTKPKPDMFISAILAGILISMGGIAYLSNENKIIGAIFFTVGLFTICTFQFNLFTGKVCYALSESKNYKINLIPIWIGNLIGAITTSTVIKPTRLYPTISEKAISIVEPKLNDSLLSIFILAIFCNILIYIAVSGYRENPHEIGKYLSIFLGVTVFILCGFEHCIANMFYISIAGKWTIQSALFIMINTLGNTTGGIFAHNIRKYC